MKSNNIEEPWKNEPEYQEAQELINTLNQVRKTGYLHIKEEDTTRMVEVTVEKPAFGYTRPGQGEYQSRVNELNNV